MAGSAPAFRGSFCEFLSGTRTWCESDWTPDRASEPEHISESTWRWIWKDRNPKQGGMRCNATNRRMCAKKGDGDETADAGDLSGDGGRSRDGRGCPSGPGCQPLCRERHRLLLFDSDGPERRP